MRPSSLGLLHQFVRRADLLGIGHQFFFGHVLELADFAQHGAGMAHSLHHVAGAGLALGADHRRAFADAAQRLAQVAASAHERDLEIVLEDVMFLIRRGQHFGFVDVIDAERFQDLRFHEMPDAAFGHDRDLKPCP